MERQKWVTALELAKAKAIQVTIVSMATAEGKLILFQMQMMESDEEDEGDAEFAVEISKQELVVFNLGLFFLLSSCFCSGECDQGYGS